MMKFQLINDGISADLRDDFWNDMLMVFGLTNTFIYICCYFVIMS